MLDSTRLEAELSDLLAEIGVPPDRRPDRSDEPQAHPLADSAAVSEESESGQGRTGQEAADIETAMDLLRLSVKYLLFDLDATRRENGSLRKMLRERREEQES
jgi:hypothetical protein